MSRRPAKRRKPSARYQTKRMPWGEPFDALFRLPAGWTPPADVLIRMGSRTWTYVADFTADTGEAWRHTIRIDPVGMSVLAEELSARFLFKGKKS